MKKLVYSIGLMLSISTLAGCELYFGNNGGGDNWNYCGSDGYYQCSGNDCTWVASTCPAGTGSGSGSSTGSGSGSGYECTTNTDCSSGCYCNNGTCTEGGFCSMDSDCGPGYFCDTSRSSCEPNPTPPPPTTCDYDNQCPQGQYCAPATNTCTATCVCSNDTEAIQQGFGWCDPTRDTCLPGANPAGSCGGTVTCSTAEPTCPSGQVPLIFNGCWNNQCEAFASCDVAPACADINDETDCLNDTVAGSSLTCAATYTGIDCTNSSGTQCQSGDSGCTCASFEFATCTASDIGRVVVHNQSGQVINASPQTR